MSKIHDLNVGGMIFQAHRTTLERSIFLKTLLSSDFDDDSLDTDGKLFIDRDPELFKQVLKLLRGYRFHSNPVLSWEEVKAEADFYQVPDLEILAPETPVIVVVPEETVLVRRLRLTEFPTRRGKVHYTVSDSDWSQLPADLANKVFYLSAHGPTCLDIATVLAAGYELKNEKESEDADEFQQQMIYECREKIIYHAKTPGTVLQVPKLQNEVLREDCPHWICITCRSKVGE